MKITIGQMAGNLSALERGGEADMGSGGFPLVARAVLLAVFGLVSLATLAGNCLVLAAFHREKKLRTVTNYFLFSLAISDLLIASISMPLYSIYIIMEQRWLFGETCCHLYLSLDYTVCGASALHLCAISLDRYFSISKPLKYRPIRTSTRVKTAILVVWLIPLLTWCPAIILWPKFISRSAQSTECYVEFLSNPLFASLTAFLAFYLPVIIMVVLYVKIWLITRRRAKEFSPSGVCMMPSLSKIAQKQGVAVGIINIDGTAAAQALRRSRSEHESVAATRKAAKSTSNFHSTSNLADNGAISRLSEPSRRTRVDTLDSISEANHSDSNSGGGGGCGAGAASPLDSRHATKRPRRTSGGQIGKSSTGNHGGHSCSDRKAAKTLTLIVAAFILTWTPYNVNVLLQAFGFYISELVWALSYWLCYINSTLNPVCYALANPTFRQTFFDILRCRKVESQQTQFSMRLRQYEKKSLQRSARAKITNTHV